MLPGHERADVAWRAPEPRPGSAIVAVDQPILPGRGAAPGGQRHREVFSAASLARKRICRYRPGARAPDAGPIQRAQAGARTSARPRVFTPARRGTVTVICRSVFQVNL